MSKKETKNIIHTGEYIDCTPNWVPVIAHAIQEYEGRLKNLNVYLGDSVERISQLMEEV